MNSEFIYHVILTNPIRKDTLAFEFDNPVDATHFCRAAIETFDALFELNVNIEITRRIVLSEDKETKF